MLPDKFCIRRSTLKWFVAVLAAIVVIFFLTALIAPWLVIPKRGATANNRWFHDHGSNTAVVFVHGIFSDSTGCWTYIDPASHHTVYWPDLMHRNAPFDDVSIFVAGYYTSLNGGSCGVSESAKQLWTALSRPPKGSKISVLDKQNILFVCHSTGGIVTRKLLIDHASDFHDKNVGLVLIASPSAGSELANKASFLANVYDNQLAGELAPGSPILTEIDAKFRDLVYKRKIPNLVGMEAYENDPIVWRRLTGLKVVPASSAGRYFGSARPLPDTNHFTSVKPPDTNHAAYRAVLDFYQGDFQSCVHNPSARHPFENSDRISIGTELGTRLATVASDGTSVAYVNESAGRHSIEFIDFQGRAATKRTLVPATRDGHIIGLTFSPNDDYIYYVLGRPKNDKVHEMRRVRVSGTGDERVLDDVDSGVVFVGTNEVAFIRGDGVEGTSICIAKIDGGAPRVVGIETLSTTTGYPYFAGVVAIPDSSDVVAIENDPRNESMRLVRIARKKPDLRLPIKCQHEWRDIDAVAWLRSGVILVAASTREDLSHSIWSIDSATGDVHRITHEIGDYRSVAVSADGHRLVGVNVVTSATLRVVSAGGTDVPYDPPGSARYDGMGGVAAGDAVSATYTTRNGGSQDLLYWNRLTNQVIRIVSGDGTTEQPSICADAKQVVFARRMKGTRTVWEAPLDGKTPPVQRTSGTWDSGPDCSSDGARLVYTSRLGNDRGIWMIEGKRKPRLIAKRLAAYPSFSPDGRRLAFVFSDPARDYQSTLAVADLQTGKITSIPGLEISSLLAPRPRWFSDSEIDVAKYDAGIWRLWSVNFGSVESVVPVRIAPRFVLSGQNVYSYDWSSGRDALVYSGGELSGSLVTLAE